MTLESFECSFGFALLGFIVRSSERVVQVLIETCDFLLKLRDCFGLALADHFRKILVFKHHAVRCELCTDFLDQLTSLIS
ncbi:MAG TPA: hypothetical protein VFS47_05425 [Steroidobacteraceae bacterium]|nr:hypothetical protein [Steroidobacteraceae bacterium]